MFVVFQNYFYMVVIEDKSPSPLTVFEGIRLSLKIFFPCL